MSEQNREKNEPTDTHLNDPPPQTLEDESTQDDSQAIIMFDDDDQTDAHDNHLNDPPSQTLEDESTQDDSQAIIMFDDDDQADAHDDHLNDDANVYTKSDHVGVGFSDENPFIAELIEGSPAAGSLVVAQELLPEEILVLPLSERPLFPGITIPLTISHKEFAPTTQKLATLDHKVIGMVLAKEYGDENPMESTLHTTGTLCRVLKGMGTPDGIHHLLVQTIRRFHIKDTKREGHTISCQVEYISDPEGKPDEELKAYTLAIISSVKKLLRLHPLFQEQLKLLLANLSFDRPGSIMDLICSMLTSNGVKLQDALETYPLTPRAEKLLSLMQEEIQLFQLQNKIQKGIEEKISKQQKEFFLHEQLKAIKKELGLEKDTKQAESDRYKERIEKLKLSDEAKKIIDEEMDKLSFLEPVSAEYNVVRTYLDWLTILPWGIFSEDSYDIKKVKMILDRDHFGLDDVKERIIEYIAKGKKTGKVTGSILCFAGPPGVGKTSIGKSVAEAVGRKFYRFSLGGMRDEAEIKGHRRTYIGAMPGKFLQSMKITSTQNPVIMLDEIDKIGASFHGDPAGALLEVLDPEQNREFLDHYLDVRFDLSQVLFIATANQLDTIPAALLDRMEVIRLSGYILEEKLEIAKKFLIPRALIEHGLTSEDVNISDDALCKIIDGYAREAGVRNFENRIKKIMRKVTRFHAEGDTQSRTIEPANIEEYLGQPVHTDDIFYKEEMAGVVIGLAWTSMGGATLHVEATAIPAANPILKQTGQLGDVMQESVEIALSYLKSHAEQFGIEKDFFNKHTIHLHLPAGATPKDGPSAGITVTAAMYSLALNKPTGNHIAMTGEITLTGKVLPVGGIKEKLIAARRVGLRELILPRENLKDYKELPEYIKKGLKIYFVTNFTDVIRVLYELPRKQHFNQLKTNKN